MKETPVRDIQLNKGMNSNELVKELHNSGGFTARKYQLVLISLKI